MLGVPRKWADVYVCPTFALCFERNLSRQRPLKNWSARTPQRIALRITMSMRVRKPFEWPYRCARCHCHSPTRAAAVAPDYDRAESDRRCMNVIADRRSLFNMDCHCSNPIAAGTAAILDEGIFQQRFASDSGMKNRFKPTLSASEIFSNVPRLGVICPLRCGE